MKIICKKNIREIKMKNLIVLTILSVLILAACTQTSKSFVEGVVPDGAYNGQMVYL
jgi:major membrane immunogen (membrane-anchored lipoprotein)